MAKGKNKKKSRTYISSIDFNNFKAFKGKKNVKLGPKVNLIFGKNSTGKSSIFQSLRLFRQSVGKDNLTPINYESPDKFKGKGGLDFDIGFQGLICDGDIKKSLGLGVSFSKKFENDKRKREGEYIILIFIKKILTQI